MKRLFDIVASLIILIIFSPVIIVTAGLIAYFLGRPVLFTQVRPGLNGRPFTLYKFRTMKDTRNKDGEYLPDIERTTNIGKQIRRFSLDEFPQLFNVLKGDMSLIGPRPLLMEYLPLYNEEQKRRHHVRPGITGWAQVNGRNSTTWEQRFKLDVWYVENYNFWLDIKILCMTVMKVIRGSGVNNSSQDTMPKFRGNELGNE